MNMQIHHEILWEIRQLEALRGEWTALLGRSATNEPTLSPDWVLAWWDVFGKIGNRSLCAIALRSNGRLVGLLPLVSRLVWDHGMPLRRVELFPSGEDERDEIASEYLAFVVERGIEVAASDKLIDVVTSRAFHAWDELVLPAMDGSSSLPNALVNGFSAQGLSVTKNERTRCPFISLPDTFEAYLATLSSSNRAYVQRSIRDVERFAKGDLKLRIARTQVEFASARQVLLQLHESRWHARGKQGAFESPKFAAFHENVMPALFEQGALELIELVTQGQTIAVLYNVVWNDKVYFYQSGRRTDLPNKLRPGIVAHAFAIREAIKLGRREYDFLGGPSRYKMCLAPSSRPLVDVRVARPSLRESIRGGVVTVRDHVRNWRVFSGRELKVGEGT